MLILLNDAMLILQEMMQARLFLGNKYLSFPSKPQVHFAQMKQEHQGGETGKPSSCDMATILIPQWEPPGTCPFVGTWLPNRITKQY